ncbi:unnamed protein product [Symbiodinium necroappetens]|uniref:RRM domain-containing protein n=1 Tax=Symbiodinium necroappetens TaxID=1628268 RepID=A0A813BB80_9DINO|nr:unnamed protein product [Symbiodinium necroappetens]
MAWWSPVPFHWLSLGKACVQFASSRDAASAVRELDGSVLDARVIRVDAWENHHWPCRNRNEMACYVYVSGLSFYTQGWKLKRHMERSGPVVWAQIMMVGGHSRQFPPNYWQKSALQARLDRLQEHCHGCEEPTLQRDVYPEDSCSIPSEQPVDRAKIKIDFFSLPLVILDKVIEYSGTFSCTLLCRRASTDLADCAVRSLQACTTAALLLSFRQRFGLPLLRGEHAAHSAVRSLTACVRFAGTYTRNNPKAMVGLVGNILDCLHCDESGVRTGATEFLKKLTERGFQIRRLVAKGLLTALGGTRQGHELSMSERSRSVAILGLCAGQLGRFAAAAVALLHESAKRQEKGAMQALAALMQAEPVNKHPRAAKFLAAANAT